MRNNQNQCTSEVNDFEEDRTASKDSKNELEMRYDVRAMCKLLGGFDNKALPTKCSLFRIHEHSDS